MAFFKLASDASGKDRDHFVTVGGWLALDTQWKKLEHVWRPFLKEHGVGYLHLRSFGTPDCKFGTGTWPVRKREEFLLRLVDIAQSHSRRCWSISTEVGVYSRIVGSSSNSDMLGPSYSGCAQSFMARVEEWLEQQQLRFEPVAYIFEDGDRKTEVIHAYDEVKRQSKGLIPRAAEELRSICFLGKDSIPLQVADLLCHPINRLLQAVLSEKGTLAVKPNASVTLLLEYKDVFDPLQSALLDARRFSQECYVMNEVAWSRIVQNMNAAISTNPKMTARRRKSKINQGKSKRRQPII